MLHPNTVGALPRVCPRRRRDAAGWLYIVACLGVLGLLLDSLAFLVEACFLHVFSVYLACSFWVAYY